MKKLNTGELIALFEQAKINLRQYHTTWRYGQGIFNTGLGLYPELFEQIRGTEADPFHQNSRVPAMVEYLFDSAAVTYYYRILHIKN
jgi:hypothetical protein